MMSSREAERETPFRVEGEGRVTQAVRRERSCRLVYVGQDGDLYQAGLAPRDDGLAAVNLARRTSRARRLTCGWEGSGDDSRLYYVWPSYSPDGSLVACFGVRSGVGTHPESGLYAVTEDGVAMHEIWRTSDAVPICESWSADSSRIALLLQAENGLSLELADVRRPGLTTLVEKGSPLFWSWSPTTNLLAVHTGGSSSVYEDARLTIFDTAKGCRPVTELRPGEFRTPAWSPDGTRLAYVDAGDDDREMLAIYRLDDGVSEMVAGVEGHSAILWSPDGRYIALSQALGETPHLFTGVSIVDVRTGRAWVVSDENVVAFFWSPCSSRIFSLAFSDDGGMQWSSIDLQGICQKLEVRFYPSRELVYFCWFFDQFAISHPLISPDGQSLTFAGHIADRDGQKLEAEAAVYVQSVIEPSPPERVGPGHFGCWDASLR
jgi:Tol biopolymer transport system component